MTIANGAGLLAAFPACPRCEAWPELFARKPNPEEQTPIRLPPYGRILRFHKRHELRNDLHFTTEAPKSENRQKGFSFISNLGRILRAPIQSRGPRPKE